MLCTRDFPHILKPVTLFKDREATALPAVAVVVGEVNRLGELSPVINRHSLRHTKAQEASLRIHLVHVSDTVETLLQIEGLL